MKRKILCLLLLLVAWNLNAQTPKKVKIANAGEIEIRSTNSSDVQSVIVQKKTTSLQSQSAEKRLIVRLKSEPLAPHAANANVRKGSLENEHQLFKEDFQKIHSSNNGARKSSTVPKILLEYKNTFNGFSIITDADGEQKIKELSYVQYVTEDKKVEAIDNTSNQIIQADKVWTDLNITGRGVVIGIIDTGIDYTHPDLGGSIGVGSKVIGGYDFVNNDNDPMDDHGHGTHVAGIAAANGVIKGVAPDAKLVAFKVLTAGGWGWDSWILAAIERTVDPDQNPNTDDALDVVNMSLGRAADVNDPYSEAINNATLQGVTFVVAAGNAGDYQTVGTPGVAESAITVAATDSYDATAYFSSKGPAPYTFNIKPDVAAPGVSIYSTFPGSKYETMSGTSMASPHVTGAVALLLEKHPTWSPELLKSALMNSCKPSSEPIWHQGAGRIDILKAIQQEVVVTPGSISLGLLNDAGSWSKTITVSVTNFSNATKNISFDIEGNITHPGISHTISPSSVVLAPAQSGNVTLTFNVVPSELPLVHFTEGYFGKLVASFDQSRIESNIALVNPKSISVNMNGELPLVIFAIGTDNPTWKFFYPTSSPLSIILPEGTYNLTAMYGSDHYVIKEGISNGGTIELEKSQASNKIAFNPKSENGTKINIKDYIHRGTTVLSGYNIVHINGSLEDTIFISNSASYKIDFSLNDTAKVTPNTFYNISATSQQGIFGNKTVTNNPLDFVEVNLIHLEADENELVDVKPIIEDGIPRSFVVIYFPMISVSVNNPLRVMISKRDESIANNVFFQYALRSRPDQIWETGGIRALNPSQLTFMDRWIHPFLSVPDINSFDYKMGGSLPRWSGYLYGGENKIYILTDFCNSGMFRYHYGDVKRGPVYYQLKSDNEIIKQGTVMNELFEEGLSSGGLIQTFDTNPKPYQLVLTSGQNKVGDIIGTARVTMNFNAQNADVNPPKLEFLSLEKNGISVNEINSDESSKLRFKFYDEDCFACGYTPSTGINSSFLYIKKSSSEEWIKIETQLLNDNSHEATFLGLDEGYFDLKLTSTDNMGNILSYELKPAFKGHYSGPITFEKVSLLAPADDASQIYAQPDFQWTDAIHAISYTLQLSKEADFASTEGTYVISDNEFIPLSRLDYLTQYYWRVQANYSSGSGDWSDIFSFTTGDQSPVSLLAPVNFATDVLVTPEFQWTAAPLATSYTLQLSKSANFSLIEAETQTNATTFSPAQSLGLATSYYWRVRANFAEGPSDWSTIFTFKSEGLDAVTLVDPTNEATSVSLRPVFRWTEAENAYQYIFQISNQPDFSEIISEYSVWEPSFSLPTDLNYSTTYYWRVQVYYVEGVSEWPSPFMFTTREAPVFETVSLLSPANASTNVSTLPEFRWSSGSSALNYIIQISKQVDFSVLEFEYSTADTVLVPSSYLDYSSVYLWRVRANYELGTSNWSTPFTFSTRARISTSLVAPVNNITDVAIRPEFQWKGDPLVEIYVLQLSLLPDFSVIEKEYPTIDTLYKLSVNLKLATRYYWRVKTYYYNQSDAISAVFHFETTPGIVTLLEPGNHSHTTSTTVEFKWNKIADIPYYHFVISRNINFDPVEDVILVSDTVYRCPVDLPENNLFYWRVRPYNFSNGAYVAGTWSSMFDFSVDPEHPDVVTDPDDPDPDKPVITGVNKDLEIEKAFAYPNPFSTETQLAFNLSEPGDVTFQILDINGRELKSFIEHYSEAGKQFFTLRHSADLFNTGGFYFCKIRSKSKVEVVKLMLKL